MLRGENVMQQYFIRIRKEIRSHGYMRVAEQNRNATTQEEMHCG